jgi:hypothetical protein
MLGRNIWINHEREQDADIYLLFWECESAVYDYRKHDCVDWEGRMSGLD